MLIENRWGTSETHPFEGGIVWIYRLVRRYVTKDVGPHLLLSLIVFLVLSATLQFRSLRNALKRTLVSCDKSVFREGEILHLLDNAKHKNKKKHTSAFIVHFCMGVKNFTIARKEGFPSLLCFECANSSSSKANALKRTVVSCDKSVFRGRKYCGCFVACLHILDNAKAKTKQN